MSLESQVAELTAAVRELTAVITGKALAAPETVAPVAPAAPEPKPEAAPKAPKVDKKAPEPKPEAPKQAPVEEKQPEVLSYDAKVKPLLLAVVSKKGREALGALLAEFGVENGKDLQLPQYPEIVKKAEALLA